MSTPVATALAEADAIRHSFMEWPRVGLKVLVRRWELTEDELRESALAYLNTITDVSAPQADQKTYSGDWRAVKASAGSIRDKGGLWVYQVLVFGEFQEADYFVTENNCSYRVSTWYYWMVESLPVLPANYEGVTYSWGGISYDRETGTYSGAIVQRERLYQDTTALRSGGSYFEDETTRKQEGVTSSTTQPPSPAFVLGHLIDQGTDLSSDCTKAVTTRDRAAIERLVASKATVITMSESRVTIGDRNTSAPTYPTEQTVGEVKRVSGERNPYGLFDNDTDTRTAIASIEDPAVVVEREYGAVTERISAMHQEALPSWAFVEGELTRLAGDQNDFLLYNYVKSTRRSEPLVIPSGTTDMEWVDRTGTCYYKILQNIPSADIESYMDAFIARHAGYNIGGVPPRLGPDGTYSTILTAVPPGTSGTSDADYDLIGEWRFGFFSADGTSEYRVAVLYTRSKTTAQEYALGIEGTKTYGQIADMNVSASAFGDYGGTNWTTSRVVDRAGGYTTGSDRNRGNGRYIAIRVQKKLT